MGACQKLSYNVHPHATELGVLLKRCHHDLQCPYLYIMSLLEFVTFEFMCFLAAVESGLFTYEGNVPKKSQGGCRVLVQLLSGVRFEAEYHSLTEFVLNCALNSTLPDLVS